MTAPAKKAGSSWVRWTLLVVAVVALFVATRLLPVGEWLRDFQSWVGAFVYTFCDTYMRGWTDRFATYLGIVFLAIVLLSPGGIVGL